MATSQGIKLDERTQARLKSLAAKRNRSPHWLMRTAIEHYLDREEEYERERSEDMARWEHYVNTGEAIDDARVQTWLNELAQGKDTQWQK
jgi:predicted transcriptional regulator